MNTWLKKSCRNSKIIMQIGFLFVVLLFAAEMGYAAEIKVAVASNFSETIKVIAKKFEEKTGHHITLIFGSTGKHYTQILHGAPFDVFYAADTLRPKLLENEGIAQAGSRVTYAVGQVVLWSPNPDLVDAEGTVLHSSKFKYLAMANPKLAPYGKAAEQVMMAKGVWQKLQGKLVRGENIGQTMQFVKSGNAELGFVALSQIKGAGAAIQGSFWLPSPTLYTPITQQAVRLTNHDGARDFMRFMQSDWAKAVIASYGYSTSQ